MVKPQPIEFPDMVIIESVINLPAIFASAYQSELSQSAQLMRYRRLGHLKFGRDIAHVHFTLEQNRDDPQTGWVAEGTEEVSKMSGGLFL